MNILKFFNLLPGSITSAVLLTAFRNRLIWIVIHNESLVITHSHLLLLKSSCQLLVFSCFSLQLHFQLNILFLEFLMLGVIMLQNEVNLLGFQFFEGLNGCLELLYINLVPCQSCHDFCLVFNRPQCPYFYLSSPNNLILQLICLSFQELYLRMKVKMFLSKLLKAFQQIFVLFGQMVNFNCQFIVLGFKIFEFSMGSIELGLKIGGQHC